MLYCTQEVGTNDMKFKISGDDVENVNNLIYLVLPIGNSKFINSYWERKFSSVERAFYSLRGIGLHLDYTNPICMGFMYKQYCQSIFNYGLEIVTISKMLLKQLDIRQGILIKSFLGLSKFSRTRPLLDALCISSITDLYLKFKILFVKHIENNDLVFTVFGKLKEHYARFKTSRLSYFDQLIECSKIIESEIIGVPKNELLVKLRTKTECSNSGLVDSIRFLLYNHENFPNFKDELRGLVWVDFYNLIESPSDSSLDGLFTVA